MPSPLFHMCQPMQHVAISLKKEIVLLRVLESAHMTGDTKDTYHASHERQCDFNVHLKVWQLL